MDMIVWWCVDRGRTHFCLHDWCNEEFQWALPVMKILPPLRFVRVSHGKFTCTYSNEFGDDEKQALISRKIEMKTRPDMNWQRNEVSPECILLCSIKVGNILFELVSFNYITGRTYNLSLIKFHLHSNSPAHDQIHTPPFFCDTWITGCSLEIWPQVHFQTNLCRRWSRFMQCNYKH